MLWIILFVLWCYYLVRWKYPAFNFYVEVSVFWSETSGFKKWTLKSHKRSKHSNISQTCRVTIIVFFLSTGAGTTNIVSVLKKNELGRAASYCYFRSLSYYQLLNFNFSVGPWKHAWHNKCWGRQNYTIKQEMTQNCRYGLRAAIGTAMWNILCCWTLLHDLSINGNIMKNVFYFGEGVRWHGTQRRCLFNCEWIRLQTVSRLFYVTSHRGSHVIRWEGTKQRVHFGWNHPCDYFHRRAAQVKRFLIQP